MFKFPTSAIGVGLYLLDVNFRKKLSLKGVQFASLTNSSNYFGRVEYLNQYRRPLDTLGSFSL
jgi:hypothetical protein